VSSARGLAEISTPDLQRLAAELTRGGAGTAVTRPRLSASRLGHLWEPVHALGILEAATLATVVRAVLAERDARPRTSVDLVWTGIEAKTAYARPTVTVVRELFESAQHHVLIAGYAFDHGADIFEPLHGAMKARGVMVDIYLHIDRARSRDDLSKHLGHEVATFFAQNWRFGTPHPVIYVAPRTIDPALCESLHAKCVVVDERVAIVGSANFTDRGQSRNIEVGARIEDVGFAEALLGQFRAATNAGVFRRFDGKLE
jgi:hypothetical protein